jgi:hypothetical protein
LAMTLGSAAESLFSNFRQAGMVSQFVSLTLSTRTSFLLFFMLNTIMRRICATNVELLRLSSTMLGLNLLRDLLLRPVIVFFPIGKGRPRLDAPLSGINFSKNLSLLFALDAGVICMTCSRESTLKTNP